jgi:hypothetical protein
MRPLRSSRQVQAIQPSAAACDPGEPTQRLASNASLREAGAPESLLPAYEGSDASPDHLPRPERQRSGEQVISLPILCLVLPLMCPQVQSCPKIDPRDPIQLLRAPAAAILLPALERLCPARHGSRDDRRVAPRRSAQKGLSKVES